jgi:hypothetical protein
MLEIRDIRDTAYKPKNYEHCVCVIASRHLAMVS